VTAGASLRGRTVAVTEARRAHELATLITRLGGTPYAVPALREVPCRDLGLARAALARICAGGVDVIAFLTGVGARAFLDLAAHEGRQAALLAALAGMLVAARGPKPVTVLRGAGVRVDVVPPEPTSESLLAALAARGLAGRVVAVQRYGEEAPALVAGLGAHGATVLEIPLYEWALPEDLAPLERLVRELVDGRVDAVAFTSAPQVAHLFLVARRLGLEAALAAALGERVVVAAVGPVCAAALEARGVVPAVRPARGTMGALVHALAAFLDRGAG